MTVVDGDLPADVTDQSRFLELAHRHGQGWTLDTEWAIGSAAASSGQAYAGPDPAQDHTTTADNGVAGTVLGGNVSTTAHAQRYLTSPTFDASASVGTLYLHFYRWLNSNYSPYMVNQVEVWNGATWSVVYQSGFAPGIQDAAWTHVYYDVTAYKSAGMRVRFGFLVGNMALSSSGWNVDDVLVNNAICPQGY